MNSYITKELDYAIRISAYLAGYYQKGAIPVSRISQRLRITKPFATKIIYRLRQAIARTLLTHAPIQVFDEPTAHLDPDQEKAIMATLLNQPDRTVLLLTHRLVGLEKLDRIYVLYEGRVVESGTHQALMAAKGLYYNMVTIQNRYLRVTLNKSSDH